MRGPAPTHPHQHENSVRGIDICLRWFRKASKENENTTSKRHLHPHQRSILHSSQDVEAAQESTDR